MTVSDLIESLESIGAPDLVVEFSGLVHHIPSGSGMAFDNAFSAEVVRARDKCRIAIEAAGDFVPEPQL